MFFKARLKKRLQNFMLDVSIEIDKDEYTVVLGPSGAGKSMTLKIIAGIESALYQIVVLNGKNISEFPPEKRGIVYLPQRNSLFPHMNVFENLVFPFKANGRKMDKGLLDGVIETFRIGDILKRMTIHLSGGEARRVALARAICAQPRLLLLDEPLTFLDFHIRLELIEFLKKITDEYKIAVLHVTHDPIETYMLAQKIYLIKNGSILSEKKIPEGTDQIIDKEAVDHIVKKLLHFLGMDLFYSYPPNSI